MWQMPGYAAQRSKAVRDLNEQQQIVHLFNIQQYLPKGCSRVYVQRYVCYWGADVNVQPAEV